jgi:hypothetical protein
MIGRAINGQAMAMTTRTISGGLTLLALAVGACGGQTSGHAQGATGGVAGGNDSASAGGQTGGAGGQIGGGAAGTGGVTAGTGGMSTGTGGTAAGAGGVAGDSKCEAKCAKLLMLPCYHASHQGCMDVCAPYESCKALADLMSCIEKMPITCYPDPNGSNGGPWYGDCNSLAFNLEQLCLDPDAGPPDDGGGVVDGGCPVGAVIFCKCGDKSGKMVCDSTGVFGPCVCP